MKNRNGFKGMTALAVLMSIILFASVNVISANVLRSDRVDLTQGRLFTLSGGTRALLAKLKEPIHMQLFLSEGLLRSAPQLAAYANRVKAMLETYVSLSHGMITLEIIDPKPFSTNEDRAVAAGISRIQMDGVSDPLFFGLAATNSTTGTAKIPVFSPNREAFLEYDLTRLVAKLGEVKKPVLALVDGIGLRGNPMRGQPEAQVLTQLKEIYNVKFVSPQGAALPKHTRILMLANPQNLDSYLLYAIDQYVLSGGATMVFTDPYAETETGRRPGAPPVGHSSDLKRLFAAWGVGFNPKEAVADPTYALQTVRDVNGERVQAANYPWLGLRGKALDKKDPSLAQLNTLVLTTAGGFTATKKTTVLKPLLTASRAAGFVNASLAANPYTDPRALLSDIKHAPRPPILAARLEGPLETAFPKGPPKGDKTKGKQLTTLKGKEDVVLVGDADMLMDRDWIRHEKLLGQKFAAPFANNGDFVMNLAEQMAGGVALADLRGRAVSWRPFTRIDALRQAAQRQYLAEQQALLKKVAATKRKLQELGASASGKNGRLLDADTAATMAKFKSDLLATRAKLREVQYRLRASVNWLQTVIMALTIGLAPLLAALGALAIAFIRPRRPLPRHKAV